MRQSCVSKHEAGQGDYNIIVLIPSRKKKLQPANKYQKEPVQKPERSIARRERLKAFTEEKLVTSHGELFQTLITRSEITDQVALLHCRLNNL